jgi:hypothetical protein
VIVGLLILAAIAGSFYWLIRYFKRENDRLILESADIIGNVAELEVKHKSQNDFENSVDRIENNHDGRNSERIDPKNQVLLPLDSQGLTVSVNDDSIMFEYPLPEEVTTDKFVMDESVEIAPEKAYEYEVHEAPTL